VPSLADWEIFPRDSLAGTLNFKKAALEQQLEWFKRQLFGQKSEHRVAEFDGRQLSLGELMSLSHSFVYF